MIKGLCSYYMYQQMRCPKDFRDGVTIVFIIALIVILICK